MAVMSMVERWPTGVRTRGRRSRNLVCRAAGDEGGARGTLGWAGEGWSALGNDEPAGEEAAAGKTRAPGAAAGGLSLDRALGDEGDTAVLRPAQIVEELGQVVCSPMNRGSDRE
jgi:hypothetical protein